MDTHDWMKIPEMEAADQWSDIPAIALEWEDINRKEAGGELYVIKLTMSDPESRIIVENSSMCYHAISELIGEVGVRNTNQATQMVNSICWQALRDLKVSLFLAMAGRYRSAHIIQRGIIELVGSALFFERKIKAEASPGWRRVSEWLNGDKEASPSFEEIQGVLTDLSPYLGEAIYTSLQEDREFQNLHVHTPIGGQVHEVLFEEGGVLTQPWCSNLDKQALKAWYVGYITDLFYLTTFVTEFNDSFSVSDTIQYILDCYEEIADEGVIRGIKTQDKIDLDPDYGDS